MQVRAHSLIRARVRRVGPHRSLNGATATWLGTFEVWVGHQPGDSTHALRAHRCGGARASQRAQSEVSMPFFFDCGGVARIGRYVTIVQTAMGCDGSSAAECILSLAEVEVYEVR